MMSLALIVPFLLLVLSKDAKSMRISPELRPDSVVTPPMADAVRPHVINKRWGSLLGLAFRLGASGAARVGASAARSAAAAASGAARAGLGAARFGSSLGNGAVRVGANAGARAGSLGARTGSAGARQIRHLASSGARFVAKNPKRIAAELMMLGGTVAVDQLLLNQAADVPMVGENGQNYAVDCTEGWSHLGSSGQCYAKAPVSMSYTEARVICDSAYSSLAMPKSIEENNKVVEVINSTDNSWVGLNDIAVEGQFSWEDGQALAWSNWASGQPGVGRTQVFEDCAQIQTAGRWNSVYCLDPAHFVCQSPEVRAFDVFGTGSYEWELVFRGTSGVQNSVYDAFVNFQTEAVEPGCRQVQLDEQCFHHYRNNFAVDNWGYVDEVALVLYKTGSRVAHVVFDGQGTDSSSWFDQTKVKRSSFTDLQDASNIFSIQGDNSFGRRFFMSHRYGGCNADEGWMVAVDEPHCDWERRGSSNYPRFIYAKNGNKSNWTSGEQDEADVMAVFVKYAVPT